MMKNLLIFTSLFFVLVLNTTAKEKVELQYIAVHCGNPSHNEIMQEDQFPNFKFFTAGGQVTGYTEEQKMIGKSNYLTGWYGEIPEKMGFGANYRGEYKGKYSFPGRTGTVMIIDKNGTVAYQIPPEDYSGDGWSDVRSEMRNAMNRVIRKMQKGKEADILKEKKRENLKKSAVGELEETKGSDIDKKGEGLTEWPVPELTLNTVDGNEVSLRELVQDKVTILVLYTLNGVTWQKGDKDGNISEQWDGNILVNQEQFESKSEKDFNEEAKNKGALKATAKMIGKGMLSGGGSRAFQNILSAEGELTTEEKFQAYQFFIQHLVFVQNL